METRTMALKQDYPPEFERVWKAFDTQYGSKGSKPRALKEFNDLKLNSSEVDELVDIIFDQVVEKAQFRASGQFCENFQHVERWLKNRRFEDETRRPELSQSIPKSDQRKADAAQRYLARHLDTGVVTPGSDKANLGRTRQLNIGILESDT
jgi:hypothetical protein